MGSAAARAFDSAECAWDNWDRVSRSTAPRRPWTWRSACSTRASASAIRSDAAPFLRSSASSALRSGSRAASRVASAVRSASSAPNGSPVPLRARWASSTALRASATRGAKAAWSAPSRVTSDRSEVIEAIALVRVSSMALRSVFAAKTASIWWLAIAIARRAVSKALAAASGEEAAASSALSSAPCAESRRARA